MKIGVLPPKPNALLEIFGVTKPIAGMIHMRPLPGAPRFVGGDLSDVIEWAIADATAWQEGGADGLVFENAWDLPFAKPDDIGPETAAAMTAVIMEVKRVVKMPFGINCLANAAIPALAVARATGASFVRVNQWANAYVANEGIIEGASARAMRYRSHIRGESIKIFADVHVKHGSHSIVADRSLAEQTRDVIFFDADVLIATGQRTGDATPIDEITGIKDHTDLPVIIGSGITAENAAELLRAADGAIAGSSLKEDGLWWNPVDPNRVRQLMEVVRSLRKG